MQNKFLFFLTYILFYINIIYCFVSIIKIIFKHFLAKSNCYNQRELFYVSIVIITLIFIKYFVYDLKILCYDFLLPLSAISFYIIH